MERNSIVAIASFNLLFFINIFITEFLNFPSLFLSVENFKLKLPLKAEKSGNETSVGDLEIGLNNLTIDIDAYRPRNEILS